MKSMEEVGRAAKQIKRALGLKGDLKPGDMERRRQSLDGTTVPFPKMSKEKEVSFKGLI